jgi:hypothetical protein
MKNVTNMPLPSKKRKSLDRSEGKENIKEEINDNAMRIIDRPASFEFDLGINSAINKGSPVYKELVQLLKSPKVICVLIFSY